MKSKKAYKRLSQVEERLSDVLSQYSPLDKQVEASLSSAKAAVVSAKESIKKKLEAKATPTKPGGATTSAPAAKKKTSLKTKSQPETRSAAARKRTVKQAKTVQRTRVAKVISPRATAPSNPEPQRAQAAESSSAPNSDAVFTTSST